MGTVRQRRLARDLKHLRETSNLKPEQAADRIGISLSTIQRIERGATLPKAGVLRSMLELYTTDSGARSTLTDLWHQARRRGWWIGYGDILDGTYVGLEDDAASVRSWQALAVPGLLQTEEYSRETLEVFRPGDPENQRRVEARMLRRTRFNRREDPPRLHAILDEAVLRRVVGGPEVTRDQLSYLKAAARRPNITIQVVPFAAGAHPGMAGSFVLLGFTEPEDPEVAYVESRAGDLYPEDELTLAGLNIDFSRIADAALPPDESEALLAELTDILKE